MEGLAGIINGTCNYILTQMTHKGQGFADALTEAQRLGYAEADPSFDVDGIDAAHKLTVLASIAFGVPLDFAAVGCEGITGVGAEDIRTAGTLGYRIKLLGLAKRSGPGIELRVQPTLVPDDHLIAKVDGVLNAVVVRGNVVGEVGFTGRGAGGDATASAVVADLIDAARDYGRPPRLPGLGFCRWGRKAAGDSAGRGDIQPLPAPERRRPARRAERADRRAGRAWHLDRGDFTERAPGGRGRHRRRHHQTPSPRPPSTPPWPTSSACRPCAAGRPRLRVERFT